MANNGVGVRAYLDSLVIGNSIRDSTGFGIVALGRTVGHRKNDTTSNHAGDLDPQVSGGSDLGANVCGSDTVCP